MSIARRVLEELKNQRQRRLEGKFNAIPFNLPRFSTVLPGIEQGRYYIVTASSKCGKSQLTDYLFVYNPVEWYLKHGTQSGVKLKIFYFTLEMTKEEKIRQLMSYYLYKKNGTLISPVKLQSKFEYILEQEKIGYLEEDLKFFDDFESIVSYYKVANPYGVFKELRTYAHNNGYYVDKAGNKLDTKKIETGESTEVFKIDRYVANDPDEYVICIYDHASLVTPERDKETGEIMNQHQAMTKLSKHFMHMRDRWNYIPVLVQQQALEGEKQQFTYKGDSIIQKLKPTHDGLANNKEIGRDCNYMLGMFAPNRFGVKEYDGYDLTKLKDCHRELSIIFSRHSAGSQTIPLLFLGTSNFFEELPRNITEQDYQRIDKLQKQMKE